MTPAETAGIIDQLEGAYSKRIHDTALRHWRETLAPMDHRAAQQTTRRVIREHKFLPSLAEFLAAAAAFTPRGEPFTPAPDSEEERLPVDVVRTVVAAMKTSLEQARTTRG